MCALPPGWTWKVLGFDRVCALPPRRLSSPRLGSEVSSNAPRSTRGRRAERRSENVEKEGSVSGVRCVWLASGGSVRCERATPSASCARRRSAAAHRQ